MKAGDRQKETGTTDRCPCGGARFTHCCGPYLAGTDQPERADQLMRARYTAYVVGDTDFLQATWDPSTRPASLEDADPPQWLGLKVLAYAPQDANHAEVEFVARYRANGRAFRLHERSRFHRTNGRWYYIDGQLSP
jgi:SEC-C motif-containing protein